MAIVKGANVTKYEAGGSGDNYISDGYIKSVVRQWTDTYTFAAALPANGTIDIAVLPANAKVWGVEVYWSVTLAATCMNTAPTISIGYRAATATTTSDSTFLANAETCLSTTDVNFIQWGVTSKIGSGTVLSALSIIYLRIGRIATTATAGTITTIVYYT
jgi:hypothetical protein